MTALYIGKKQASKGKEVGEMRTERNTIMTYILCDISEFFMVTTWIVVNLLSSFQPNTLNSIVTQFRF